MDIRAAKKLMDPIKRRVMNMVARAIISSISSDGLSVQVKILDGEVADKLERLQEYGFASSPLPGAECAVVFLGGNRDHGVVIATHDKQYYLKDMQNGEVALYTDEGDYIHMKRNNKIAIKTKTIEIEADDMSLTGDLQVDGEIHADGKIKSDTEVTAQSVNLTTHKHPTAVPGAPSTGVG